MKKELKTWLIKYSIFGGVGVIGISSYSKEKAQKEAIKRLSLEFPIWSLGGYIKEIREAGK